MSTQVTADQQALLDTQFSPEIEKLAEAHLASESAIEVLRAYGASLAEEMLMSHTDQDEELSKTASENKVAVAAQVEEALTDLGAHAYEQESELDEAELAEVMHKEAKAAAWAIAEGYFGEIEAAMEANPELVKTASKAMFQKAMKGLKAKGVAGKGAFAPTKMDKIKAKAGQLKQKIGDKYQDAMIAGKTKLEHGKILASENKGKLSAAGGLAAGVAAKSAHDKYKSKK